MNTSRLPAGIRAEAGRRAHELRNETIDDALRWLWQRLRPGRAATNITTVARTPSTARTANAERALSCRS